MVGWILSEQRGAANPCYPLAADHDTTSNLSNHVYGIRGGIHRKLSIGDGKLGEHVFGVNRNRPAGTPRGFILSGYSMGA